MIGACSPRWTKWLLAFAALAALLHLRSADGRANGPSADQQAAQRTPAAAPKGAAARAGTFTIAGVCVDEGGQPVANAEVVVFDYRSDELESTRIGSLQTDAMGRFRFSDLPRASHDAITNEYLSYQVFARKRGHATALRPILWTCTDSDRLRLEMPPPSTLKGRITDRAYRPVAGALVWAGGVFERPVEGFRSARTNARGEYEVTDLAPWDLQEWQKRLQESGSRADVFTRPYCRVLHPDYGQSVTWFGQIPATVDVKLQAAAVIEGRVLDEVAGKPAAGVIVSLQVTKRNDGTEGVQVRTDGDGRYRLDSLDPGEYNIWANAPQRTVVAIDSLLVQAGERKRARDLKLITGAFLEGRVIDAATEKPIHRTADGGRVWVAIHGPSRPKSGVAVDSSVLDERGRFRLRVAPGLNYPHVMNQDLWFRTEGRDEYARGVDVEAGQTLSITFRVTPRPPAKGPGTAAERPELRAGGN